MGLVEAWPADLAERFGELVLRGAEERIAPILMTALTTGLALLPLVIAGNRPGHEIEYPMAHVILGGLAMATCVAIAGRRLAGHRSYTFCLVIAGIECAFSPFGTVLGVFTIVVLIRPSVKERFGVA